MSDATLHRRLKKACSRIIELGYWGSRTLPRILPDHVAIARLAVEHYRVRGFSHFACINVVGEPMFDYRAQAFCQLLSEQGKAVTHVRWPPPRAANSWSARLHALSTQLAELPTPLAVFAVHDRVAAEALLAVLQAGRSVPGQVAILGVDNVELLDDTLPVPLSSIDTDQFGLGRQAALMLKKSLSGGEIPQLTHWAPKRLVLRASTATVGVVDPLILAFLTALDRAPSWTVAQIARHLSVRTRELHARCLATLAVGPGDYLRQHRLRQAEFALANGAQLAEAAIAAGVSGPTGLSSLVRREKGITPAQWRKKLREQR